MQFYFFFEDCASSNLTVCFCDKLIIYENQNVLDISLVTWTRSPLGFYSTGETKHTL